MRLVVGAIVVAIVGAAMAGWLIARTSSPPTGPVILISIDALRADHLGAYGYRGVRTPNIDALAADGIVFERAYSHVPLTLPAHVSILSGRLPFETGVRGDEAATLPSKIPMLPAILHRRGFKTAGIVSSALLRQETGLGSAFDFYDDEMPQDPPAASASETAARRDGARTIEVARHWVDQQSTRFFLFVHLAEPLAPCAPPQRFARYAPYDGAVTYADELVGRFIRYLRERDLYDRAIIVLLSDHGEGLGEHGEAEHGLFLYDSTLHTPLVVKLPKQERAGARRNEVVQHIDVMPTILDLMGAPRPSGLRGRSLRHLLDSRDATLAGARVYSETVYPRIHYGWSDLSAVTSDAFRYIRAPRPELYDLLQDRRERENLVATNAAKASELAAGLEKYLAAIPPPRPSPLNDEDRVALAKLGGQAAAPASAPAPPSAPAPAPAPAKSGIRQEDASAPASAPKEAPAASKADVREEPSRDPKDAVELADKVLAARRLASGRRIREATEAYRTIVAADPGMPDAWRELGQLLLTAGQPKEALEAFRHLAALDESDPDGILGAARCLMRLGKLDDAEGYAALGAKLAPVAGTELVVRVELRQRDYPSARRAAEAAQQADPSSPMVPFVEGVELYNGGKFERALPPLERAAQLAEARAIPTPDVFFYVGDTLARLRRYSDAEARLTQELRWFPENLRARESLSAVLQATGRASEVGPLIADLLRILPTPEGYAAAWRLSTVAGDKAGAAKLRSDSHKLFGESSSRAAESAPRQ